MKALVFAAGLGERMRPLTDTTPKPLLEAGGKPLIAWHLEALARAGVRDVVVNTSWLAPRFPETLGDGRHWGLRIHYSFEGDTPLETGGGMLHACPCSARPPSSRSMAMSGAIRLRAPAVRTRGRAHLVLVDNPDTTRAAISCSRANACGGGGDAHVGTAPPARRTFAGIGVYRPSLFDDWRKVIGDGPGAERTPPRFGLTPLLRAAMARDAVSGEHHRGRWTDVGTPQRLQALSRELGRADATRIQAPRAPEA